MREFECARAVVVSGCCPLLMLWVCVFLAELGADFPSGAPHAGTVQVDDDIPAISGLNPEDDEK